MSHQKDQFVQQISRRIFLDRLSNVCACKSRIILHPVSGVSALGQVLGCVLHKYTPEKLLRINEHLPEHIRVHDVISTVNSFDAWDWASHRHYSYVVPTYAFADVTCSLPSAHSYRITETHLDYVRKVEWTLEQNLTSNRCIM